MRPLPPPPQPNGRAVSVRGSRRGARRTHRSCPFCATRTRSCASHSALFFPFREDRALALDSGMGRRPDRRQPHRPFRAGVRSGPPAPESVVLAFRSKTEKTSLPVVGQERDLTLGREPRSSGCFGRAHYKVRPCPITGSGEPQGREWPCGSRDQTRIVTALLKALIQRSNGGNIPHRSRSKVADDVRCVAAVVLLMQDQERPGATSRPVRPPLQRAGPTVSFSSMPLTSNLDAVAERPLLQEIGRAHV